MTELQTIHGLIDALAPLDCTDRHAISKLRLQLDKIRFSQWSRKELGSKICGSADVKKLISEEMHEDVEYIQHKIIDLYAED